MADSATVGILKTMLTMDTSSYDAGAKRGASSSAALKKALTGVKEEVQKLTPLAERMVRGFGGDKLLHTANSLTAAVTKLGGAQKLTEAEQARVNKTLNDAITKYQRLGQVAPKAMVDLERATRGAAGGTNFLSTRMVALGAAAGVFAAQLAGQAIRGVINLGREAFEGAGKILDLRNATGLTVQTIQEMQFVADQTGGSLDNFTNAAFKLGAMIAGGGTSVKAALRDLGLEWEKVRALSMDEQWNLVTAALSKYTNEGERNRLGIALMGKGFKEVAASIGEGYRDIANQAKTATFEQLKELDRLNDEWDKFKRNLSTGFGAAMGRMVLESRIRNELIKEQAAKGIFAGENTRDFDAEVQRRLILGLADARTKDIQLTKEQAVAQVNYAIRLREATAELTKLDAGERKQLAAAQSLGAEQDELVAMLVRFGVEADRAEDVLKIYSGTMKGAAKDAKELAKSQEEVNAANMRWLDILGALEVAEMARGRSKMTILGDLGPQSAEDLIAEMRRNLEAITHLSPLEIFGDLVPQAESAEALIAQMGRDLEDLEAPGRRAGEIMRDLFAPLFGGVTGGISDLLFGRGGSDAREAKREYESLKRSGTASAEELTRAFQRVRDTQRSMWASFTTGVMDTLKNLLNYFVNGFLKGMLRAIAGTAFGKAAGDWMSTALGIGAGGGGLFGAGAGAGLGAAAAPSTAALLGAAPAAAGGGAGAAGAGIGLGAGLTFAGVGAAAAWALYAGHQDSERARRIMDAWRKGSSTWTDLEGKERPVPDRLGRMTRDWVAPRGFQPPSVSMPSMTGVGQSPLSEEHRAFGRGGGARHVTLNMNVQAIDARGVRDFVRSAEFTDSVAHVFEHNVGFVNSRVTRAQQP